jgi:hypothetical protein
MHPRAATQAVASDHTSLQRWALEPPRVSRPRTSPPYRGELWCSHVARGPGHHLLAELSSGAATRSSAPDLASLSRWAPALPRVTWLRALPSREESSGAATCSSAPDLASLLRWAPTLSRGISLASPRGELQCCHVPHGPQRAVDHRNKEGPSCPRHTARLACVQSTVTCYQGTYKVCGQVATVQFNSAT